MTQKFTPEQNREFNALMRGIEQMLEIWKESQLPTKKTARSRKNKPATAGKKRGR